MTVTPPFRKALKLTLFLKKAPIRTRLPHQFRVTARLRDFAVL